MAQLKQSHCLGVAGYELLLQSRAGKSDLFFLIINKHQVTQTNPPVVRQGRLTSAVSGDVD